MPAVPTCSFLAYRSARKAVRPASATLEAGVPPAGRAFSRGLAVHLTNPKAILFFGSLYALAVPADAPVSTLLAVMLAIAAPGLAIYAAYAVVFSRPKIAGAYLRLKRWFEAVFAIVFGLVALRVLTSRTPG